MMPSMRKKVSNFFKQLSVIGPTDCDQTDPGGSSGSFIHRYLSGCVLLCISVLFVT